MPKPAAAIAMSVMALLTLSASAEKRTVRPRFPASATTARRNATCPLGLSSACSSTSANGAALCRSRGLRNEVTATQGSAMNGSKLKPARGSPIASTARSHVPSST